MRAHLRGRWCPVLGALMLVLLVPPNEARAQHWDPSPWDPAQYDTDTSWNPEVSWDPGVNTYKRLARLAVAEDIELVPASSDVVLNSAPSEAARESRRRPSRPQRYNGVPQDSSKDRASPPSRPAGTASRSAAAGLGGESTRTAPSSRGRARANSSGRADTTTSQRRRRPESSVNEDIGDAPSSTKAPRSITTTTSFSTQEAAPPSTSTPPFSPSAPRSTRASVVSTTSSPRSTRGPPPSSEDLPSSPPSRRGGSRTRGGASRFSSATSPPPLVTRRSDDVLHEKEVTPSPTLLDKEKSFSEGLQTPRSRGPTSRGRPESAGRGGQGVGASRGASGRRRTPQTSSEGVNDVSSTTAPKIVTTQTNPPSTTHKTVNDNTPKILISVPNIPIINDPRPFSKPEILNIEKQNSILPSSTPKTIIVKSLEPIVIQAPKKLPDLQNYPSSPTPKKTIDNNNLQTTLAPKRSTVAQNLPSPFAPKKSSDAPNNVQTTLAPRTTTQNYPSSTPLPRNFPAGKNALDPQSPRRAPEKQEFLNIASPQRVHNQHRAQTPSRKAPDTHDSQNATPPRKHSHSHRSTSSPRQRSTSQNFPSTPTPKIVTTRQSIPNNPTPRPIYISPDLQSSSTPKSISLQSTPAPKITHIKSVVIVSSSEEDNFKRPDKFSQAYSSVTPKSVKSAASKQENVKPFSINIVSSSTATLTSVKNKITTVSPKIQTSTHRNIPDTPLFSNSIIPSTQTTPSPKTSQIKVLSVKSATLDLSPPSTTPRTTTPKSKSSAPYDPYKTAATKPTPTSQNTLGRISLTTAGPDIISSTPDKPLSTPATQHQTSIQQTSEEKSSTAKPQRSKGSSSRGSVRLEAVDDIDESDNYPEEFKQRLRGGGNKEIRSTTVSPRKETSREEADKVSDNLVTEPRAPAYPRRGSIKTRPTDSNVPSSTPSPRRRVPSSAPSEPSSTSIPRRRTTATPVVTSTISPTKKDVTFRNAAAIKSRGELFRKTTRDRTTPQPLSLITETPESTEPPLEVSSTVSSRYSARQRRPEIKSQQQQTPPPSEAAPAGNSSFVHRFSAKYRSDLRGASSTPAYAATVPSVTPTPPPALSQFSETDSARRGEKVDPFPSRVLTTRQAPLTTSELPPGTVPYTTPTPPTVRVVSSIASSIIPPSSTPNIRIVSSSTYAALLSTTPKIETTSNVKLYSSTERKQSTPVATTISYIVTPTTTERTLTTRQATTQRTTNILYTHSYSKVASAGVSTSTTPLPSVIIASSSAREAMTPPPRFSMRIPIAPPGTKSSTTPPVPTTSSTGRPVSVVTANSRPAPISLLTTQVYSSSTSARVPSPTTPIPRTIPSTTTTTPKPTTTTTPKPKATTTSTTTTTTTTTTKPTTTTTKDTPRKQASPTPRSLTSEIISPPRNIITLQSLNAIPQDTPPAPSPSPYFTTTLRVAPQSKQASPPPRSLSEDLGLHDRNLLPLESLFTLAPPSPPPKHRQTTTPIPGRDLASVSRGHQFTNPLTTNSVGSEDPLAAHGSTISFSATEHETNSTTTERSTYIYKIPPNPNKAGKKGASKGGITETAKFRVLTTDTVPSSSPRLTTPATTTTPIPTTASTSTTQFRWKPVTSSVSDPSSSTTFTPSPTPTTVADVTARAKGIRENLVIPPKRKKPSVTTTPSESTSARETEVSSVTNLANLAYKAISRNRSPTTTPAPDTTIATEAPARERKVPVDAVPVISDNAQSSGRRPSRVRPTTTTESPSTVSTTRGTTGSRGSTTTRDSSTAAQTSTRGTSTAGESTSSTKGMSLWVVPKSTTPEPTTTTGTKGSNKDKDGGLGGITAQDLLLLELLSQRRPNDDSSSSDLTPNGALLGAGLGGGLDLASLLAAGAAADEQNGRSTTRRPRVTSTPRAPAPQQDAGWGAGVGGSGSSLFQLLRVLGGASSLPQAPPPEPAPIELEPELDIEISSTQATRTRQRGPGRGRRPEAATTTIAPAYDDPAESDNPPPSTLVTVAINVTKTVANLMGRVLQGAAHTVSAVVREKGRLLSGYLQTWNQPPAQ